MNKQRLFIARNNFHGACQWYKYCQSISRTIRIFHRGFGRCVRSDHPSKSKQSKAVRIRIRSKLERIAHALGLPSNAMILEESKRLSA